MKNIVFALFLMTMISACKCCEDECIGSSDRVKDFLIVFSEKKTGEPLPAIMMKVVVEPQTFSLTRPYLISRDTLHVTMSDPFAYATKGSQSDPSEIQSLTFIVQDTLKVPLSFTFGKDQKTRCCPGILTSLKSISSQSPNAVTGSATLNWYQMETLPVVHIKL